VHSLLSHEIFLQDVFSGIFSSTAPPLPPTKYMYTTLCEGGGFVGDHIVLQDFSTYSCSYIIYTAGFLDFFMDVIQHCFICCPLDSTVSENTGIELYSLGP
jgi:hypothetical protein